MTTKPVDLFIDPERPWIGDILHRQEVGSILTSFLLSLSGSFVLALEAPWGSGKSVFLRRMAGNLELNDPPAPVVFLDAWRNDYLQDPMVAIIAAINTRLDKQRSGIEKNIDRIISGLAKHGAKLCGSLVNTAVKVLIPGGDEVLTAIGKFATEAGKELLEFQAEHEKSQEAFKLLLAHARDELTSSTTVGQSPPLVFILDELDRCRPNFAVHTLERIKHFFDVPGIIFIVATDGYNLPAAVSSVYGKHVDGERYLRKFIDFKFHLPDPAAEDFVWYLYEALELSDLVPNSIGVKALIERRNAVTRDYLSDKTHLGYAVADILCVFPQIANALGLSLRDQLQSMTIVNCVLRSCPVGFPLLPNILCFLAALRFVSYEAYEKFRIGRDTSVEVGLINAVAKPEFVASPVGHALVYTFHATTLSLVRRVELDAQYRQAAATQHDRQDVFRELACATSSLRTLPEERSTDVIKRLLSLAEAFAPAR